MQAPSRPREAAALLLSGAALGASWIFLFRAYQTIGVGVSSLLYYCGPIIVMALSPFIFGEKLTGGKIAGFIAVACGAFLIAAQGLGGSMPIAGIVCGIASAFCYALMVIASKGAPHIEGLENSTLQVSAAFETALVLTLIPQVGRRYQMAKRRQQPILRSSEDAGNYLVPLYLYERTEVVYLLCLDAKCGLISCKEVGRGVGNAAEVSVRAIVETALSQKAVSVILSHNHVDAYALPSREDELTTRRIRDALLLVGITLADHIIVCGEDYVSFADSGLL